MIQKAVEPSRTIRLGEMEDAIEVVSPAGDATVRIVFEPGGPVVTVSASRVQLRAGELEIRCRKLDVSAEEEIRLRSKGDLHLNGATLRLNCD